MSNTSISSAELERILATLIGPNAAASERYPGASDAPQPVHTVYGGAHLFTSDIAQKLGAAALLALDTYAPDGPALARALEWPDALMSRVYPRVVEKLTREPVEDFRIDFEDGFGNRPDDEEDHHARAAAEQVARGMKAKSLPASLGIRIKTFSEELKRRSLRTLDIFLTSLLDTSGGVLPPRFFITLPKITARGQVAALAAACDAFERARGLAAGTLKIELMVETPQSVFAADGTIALPRLAAEGEGRVTGAHFGTYDYTASLAITAAHQHMAHPSCDFAKHVMQVSLAGMPVQLSDGATNVMPVGPHRAERGGTLSPEELADNRNTVHRAWRLHSEHIRHSLAGGFYQGWDLHPAQLPTRFATVFAFFLEGVAPASERLRNFVSKAAQATLVGDVFDDAATGQGLLNYFLRAMNCGALTEAETVELSGLTLDELRGRSFLRILAGRRERPSLR